MGRARHRIPRSRAPLHRRVRSDPSALRSWLLVAGGSLLVTWGVARTLAQAEQAEQRWGERASVLVTTGDVREGAALAGRVRVERWPAGLVPPGALRRLPPQARAASAISEGLPLTSSALQATGDGLRGRVLVPVPVPEASLPLRRGQRVDVWATSDPSLTEGRLTTARVAEAARVERTTSSTVVLAVPPAAADELVEATATATITIVRVR